MQSIETDLPMTTPGGFEDSPLPKRNGHRGMLPSTWLGRPVRIAYTDAHGLGVEASATLLDYCGTGPVFNLAGGKVLLAWDQLVMLELVND